ncbi:MAG: PAS domain S-box-containing protein, partial [Sulfurimonas sp.]
MRKYYLLFLAGLIASVLISLLLISNLASSLYENETNKIVNSHQSIKKEVLSFKKNKAPFLLMIPKHEKVLNYLQNRDISSYEETKRFLYYLTLSDRNIFQLRIFDINGDELLRVERSANKKVFYVKEENLQNKAQRYYFKKFLKLKKGNVGFSNLDLNVENGKIEVPWRPTLRIGTPIFKDGKKLGLVIINYSMKEWIDSLSSLTSDNFYLVDENGYFIYHPDDKWKWSFHQIPSSKADEYFHKGQNKEHKIADYEDHYHKEENLYVENIVFFNKEKILAIYEPKIPISETLYNYSINIVIYIILIFLFTAIPIALLFYSFIRTLRNEKNLLKATKDKMTLVFNSTSEAILVINKKAIIQDLNNSAIQLFGYERDELLGKNIKIIVPEPHKTNHDDYVGSYKDNGMARYFDIERNLYAVCKNNKYIPITLTITSIEDNSGTLFMGSIKDVSQIKKAR